MSSLSLSPSVSDSPVNARPGIRLWLWCVTVLVLIMVTVGGATRLTGSGLSITEWRPITGAIPPLSLEAWLVEFDKYRQIPQYQLVNKGMSLDEFKFIYWWEWGHRQLGRFIGLLYLLGLLIVAARRLLPPREILVLFGMGLVLGLQGAIGWIMVASGLKEGMVAVAPVKLTLHLSFASLFFASLVMMIVYLSPARARELRLTGPSLTASWFLVAAVFGQIALGGLVAGSRAGMTFNTWPLMDGALVPSSSTLFAMDGITQNLVGNVALIQFNHRLGAYLLLALALWHGLSLWRRVPGSGPARRAAAIAGLTLTQGVLGIVTLLLVVPLWAGLAHQALAMIVLAMAVAHAMRNTLSRSRVTSIPG